MNVPDDTLLASMRTPGACDYCGKECPNRAAHHIFTRGAGQVDWAPNLIALGWDAPGCVCHVGFHYSGKPSMVQLLANSAARHGMTPDLIESTIHAIRACPRSSTFAKASGWLREHFPREVAESAIGVIRKVYEV